MAEMERQDSVLRGLGECPICSEEYSQEREPKQLPCSHTVCLLCLERMLEVSSARIGHSNSLSCPMCRNDVKMPGGGATELPTNRLVLNFMEVLNLGEIEVGTSGGNGYKCNFCRRSAQDMDKIMYCKDCGKYICKACAERHKNVSRFRKHAIVSTCDSTVVCQNHKEMFRHLCLTCNRLLCDICIHEEVCQDHEVDDLHQVAGSREEKLRDLIADIVLGVENINQYIDPEVGSKIAILTGVKHSVNKHTDAVINRAIKTARTREKRILQHIQKHYEKLVEVKKEVQNARLAHLQSLKEVAEAVLDKGAEHIVMALPNIRARLESVDTLSHLSSADHDIVNSVVNFAPLETLEIGEISIKSAATQLEKTQGDVIHGRRRSLNRGGSGEALPESREYLAAQQHQATSSAQHEADHRPMRYEPVIVPNYRVMPQLLMETGGLMDGWDVTFLPSGRIAVTDKPSRSGSCRVLLFNNKGTLESDSSQRGVQLKDPRGITYHHGMHNILVADQGAGCLHVLDAVDLSAIRTMGLSGIGSPWGVAVLSDGEIVVAGWHSTVGSPGVGIFRIDGSQITRWGTWGRGDGQFHSPWYVAVNHLDHVLVSDRVNQCVQIFDRNGTFLVKFGNPETLPMPWGLCTDPEGNIIVACVGGSTPPHVSAWSPDGHRLSRLLHWSAQEKESRGWLMSVSLHGSFLAVLGNNKLLMYKCGTVTTP